MKSNPIKAAAAAAMISLPSSAFVVVPAAVCSNHGHSFVGGKSSPATAAAEADWGPTRMGRRIGTRGGRRVGTSEGHATSLRCSAAATEFDLKT